MGEGVSFCRVGDEIAGKSRSTLSSNSLDRMYWHLSPHYFGSTFHLGRKIRFRSSTWARVFFDWRPRYFASLLSPIYSVQLLTVESINVCLRNLSPPHASTPLVSKASAFKDLEENQEGNLNTQEEDQKEGDEEKKQAAQAQKKQAAQAPQANESSSESESSEEEEETDDQFDYVSKKDRAYLEKIKVASAGGKIVEFLVRDSDGKEFLARMKEGKMKEKKVRSFLLSLLMSFWASDVIIFARYLQFVAPDKLWSLEADNEAEKKFQKKLKLWVADLQSREWPTKLTCLIRLF